MSRSRVFSIWVSPSQLDGEGQPAWQYRNRASKSALRPADTTAPTGQSLSIRSLSGAVFNLGFRRQALNAIEGGCVYVRTVLTKP